MSTLVTETEPLPPLAARSEPLQQPKPFSQESPVSVAQPLTMVPHSNPSAPEPVAAAGRLISIDAYRGLVMVLMVSAGLGIGKVVKSLDAAQTMQPGAMRIWHALAYQ